MMFRSEKMFKISPRSTRQVAEKEDLLARQLRWAQTKWPARNPGYERSDQPQCQNRSGQDPTRRTGGYYDTPRSYRHHRRNPHGSCGCQESAGNSLCRFGRRLPFQNPVSADAQTPECPQNRVEVHAGLKREEHEFHALNCPRPRFIDQDTSEVRRPSGLFGLGQKGVRRSRQAWQKIESEQGRRPAQCPVRHSRPAEDEGRQESSRDEAAPQVVEDHPFRQCPERIDHALSIRTGHRGQQPLGNLPVSSDPPVMAPGIGQIRRRGVLD